MYDVYGVLGSGLLAKVRQGIHQISKKTYAIKTIDLSKLRADQRESLRRETNIMKAVDQPDTIQIHEIFEEEDKLHLVLEFSEGADILEYTLALELFEYIVMKTSVLYSPHRNSQPSTTTRRTTLNLGQNARHCTRSPRPTTQ